MRNIFLVYRCKGFLLALMFLYCLDRASALSAQGPTWTSIGPEGGAIAVLAIDPGTPTCMPGRIWGTN